METGSRSQSKPAAMQPSRSAASSGESTKRQALQALVALSEALPRASSREPFTPEVLEFMAEGLADLSPDAILGAAMKALRVCRFMPTVAEIRELAGCPAITPTKAAQAEAEAAWLRVRGWCVRNRVSNPHSGIFGMPEPGSELGGQLSHRELQSLALAGGINRVVCSRDTGDEQWCRKAFIEAYVLSPAVDDARKSLLAAQGEALALADGLAATLALGGPQK